MITNERFCSSWILFLKFPFLLNKKLNSFKININEIILIKDPKFYIQKLEIDIYFLNKSAK